MVSLNGILALVLVSAAAAAAQAITSPSFTNRITGQFRVDYPQVQSNHVRQIVLKDAIKEAIAEVSGMPLSQVVASMSVKPANYLNWIQVYYEVVVTDEQSTTAASSLSDATNFNLGFALRLALAGSPCWRPSEHLCGVPSVCVTAKTQPIIASLATSTTTTSQCFPTGAGVHVLGITYLKWNFGGMGMFFSFLSDEWSAVFGPWRSESTHNIEQFRCGVKIWEGNVIVWENTNLNLGEPLAGRRSAGYAVDQWQINDMIRKKTGTAITSTTSTVAPTTGFSIQLLSAAACPGGQYLVASEAECQAAAAQLGKPYYRKIERSDFVSNCFCDEHYDHFSFNVGGSLTASGYAVCATEVGTSERFSGVVSFSLPGADKTMLEDATRTTIAAYFGVAAFTVSTIATESRRLGAGSRRLPGDWSVVFEFRAPPTVAAAVADKVAAIAATPYLFKTAFAEQFQAHLLGAVDSSNLNALVVTGITAKHHTTGGVTTTTTTSEGGTSGGSEGTWPRHVSGACKIVASIAAIIAINTLFWSCELGQ